MSAYAYALFCPALTVVPFKILSSPETIEGTSIKAFATELCQRFANSAVNILGLGGALEQFSYLAPAEGRMNFFYLMTLHFTISAGTSEIQRNIVAQRGLGLPRS